MKPSRSPKKKAISVRIDAALVDEYRAFVRDFAGKPIYCTPSGFIADAITAHLIAMRRRIGDDAGKTTADHIGGRTR